MPVGGKGLLIGGLGLLGIALLASSSSASASTGGGGEGPSTGGKNCFDSHLPPDMKAQVQQMLTSSTITPTDLEAAALAAETGGFPLAAGCLRQRAQELRTKAEMEVAAKGGMPFTIRYGDIPFQLAKYYTGDGSRFFELRPLNPQIGALKTVNGVSNYENWKPGLQILIPAAWNPLAKPIPAPLSGGGGGGKPPPGQQSGEGEVAMPEDEEEGGQSIPPNPPIIDPVLPEQSWADVVGELLGL